VSLPLSGVNVHIYPSPFEFESRILKVTKTLIARGIVSKILVIATAREGLPGQQAIDAARDVRRVGTRLGGERFVGKVLRFAEWTARVFLLLRRERVSLVNCHSLSVLPLCVLVQWWHRCTLVYEPHELETETSTSVGVRRTLAQLTERLCITSARMVIAVSASIAAQYQRDYHLAQVHVIRNVPELASPEPPAATRVFRDHFGIPDDHTVFIYQGALEPERGVGWILEAFRRLGGAHHIVLMGFGSLQADIVDAARTSHNIHFHPAVRPSEVATYTRGADVGIAPLTDDCLNHRFALPNKLFEYLHAGLPVIVSDLDEMRGVVERYACGWAVPNEAEALVACITALRPEHLARGRLGALRARAEMQWAVEADTMAAIYTELLSRYDGVRGTAA
jgi:glycosyltransferase involved in cell wall biosynthesis